MNLVFNSKCNIGACAFMFFSLSVLFLSLSVQANTKAGKSRELQVNEHFNFTSHRKVTLDVSAIDNKGEPIANALMRVFVVEYELSEEGESLPRKSLVAMARTDAAGWLVHEIEIPQTYQTLILEVQNMEVEQQKVVQLGEEGSVQVSF